MVNFNLVRILRENNITYIKIYSIGTLSFTALKVLPSQALVVSKTLKTTNLLNTCFTSS